MRIAIRKLLRKVRPAQLAIALGAGLLGLNAAAGPVVAYTEQDGREWMQVTRTKGFYFGSIATTCSGTNGGCSGTVNGVDLTGWNFASGSDVRSMFIDAGVPLQGAETEVTGQYDTSWMSGLVDSDGLGGRAGYFNATGVEFALGRLRSAYVLGYTREPHPSVRHSHNSAYLVDYSQSGDMDLAITANPLSYPSYSEVGYWLYRDAATSNGTLPTPASLPLIILAGVAMVAARRRRG